MKAPQKGRHRFLELGRPSSVERHESSFLLTKEVMMTMSTRNRWYSYLATLAIAAVGLVATALPLAPAKAQVGVQVGPFGFGIAPPPPAWSYAPYSHPTYP